MNKYLQKIIFYHSGITKDTQLVVTSTTFTKGSIFTSTCTYTFTSDFYNSGDTPIIEIEDS